MIKHKVILQSQPEKYFRKTDTRTAEALEACFMKLEETPFHSQGKIKRLKGVEGLYRYAVGGLRVIYEVNESRKEVGVVAIFPRGDVCKKIRG